MSLDRYVEMVDRALAEFSSGTGPAAQTAVADLHEAFQERAAILEHEAGLSRDESDLEAARTIAVLARNRGYAWGVLRQVLASHPALLAQIPDRTGAVDTLPFGVAKFAVMPWGVLRQGKYRHEKNEFDEKSP